MTDTSVSMFIGASYGDHYTTPFPNLLQGIYFIAQVNGKGLRKRPGPELILQPEVSVNWTQLVFSPFRTLISHTLIYPSCVYTHAHMYGDNVCAYMYSIYVYRQLCA